MTRKEQQYAEIFGPFRPGDYSIGDTITFDSGQSSGTVIWSFVNEENERFFYVVDDGSGFPVEIERNEVVQKEGW